MVLHGGEAATRSFYDALEVNKGPSLGTNYTLVCPYTLLAHYGELDWAEACGVSRYLLRVSVGLEPLETLIARFDKAFEAIRSQR
jgi:cystathionine gamma-synthase